jgi:carboxymethylenebutenolidase
VLGFGFIAPSADSPHLAFAKAKGEFYCAFAELDDIVLASVPAALAEFLRRIGSPHRIVIHPGARHPYAFPDRAVYDRGAAEADWAEIFAMLGRNICVSAKPERA